MGSGVLRHGPLPTNLLLCAAVSAIFLGLLEAGARLLEKRSPGAPMAPYIWNWEEMWEGDFYRIRSEVNGWPPWEEFNADGLRDRTHAEEKPSGTMRLIFLGDSVTAGGQIEEEEALPPVLQAPVHEGGGAGRGVNVAAPGLAPR